MTLEPSAPVLRVMTYNIRYDEPKDPFLWTERRAGLAELLRGSAPDIFGLQEVLTHQLRDLGAALPEYAHVGVGRGPSLDRGEHNPVFYRSARLKLLDSGTFWLSSTPEVPGSCYEATSFPRIATWAKLEDTRTGTGFYFVNTHFPYEEDAAGEAARAFSAEVLLAQLARIAGETPTILTGDFNLTTSNASDYLQTYLPLRRRFDDAFGAAALRRGPEPTYVGFELTGSAVRRRIDYIFTSRAHKLSVLAYETLTNHAGSYHFSDHLPILVELSF